MEKNPTPTIRDVYPDLIEQDLAEAEDRLGRYLALVLRIFERNQSDDNPHSNKLTRYNGTLPCTLPLPPTSNSSAK
jgi:hypothetical protein